MSKFKVDMSEVPKGEYGKYIIKEGFRFNRLTVLEEVYPSKRRRFKLICDCGKIKHADLTSLVEGKVASCGCLNKELSIERLTKHNMDGTRLNSCWKDMRKRAKQREDCNVYVEWEDFIVFYNWSISNGYDDTKVLSRYLDRGDYSPDNCRWVSKRHNVTEASSYYWRITLPNGVTEVIYNMSEYCRINDLCFSSISEIASGKQFKYGKYAKFKVDKLSHGTSNNDLWEEELYKYE